jgi:hypothetical protein
MDKDKELIVNLKQSILNNPHQGGDLRTNDEVRNYDLERLKAESFAQDISERKKFAHRIFWMVVGWLVSIITIVVLVGCKIIILSDSILMSLIGSTTVNVTTFFLVVTKYLFPSNKSES